MYVSCQISAVVSCLSKSEQATSQRMSLSSRLGWYDAPLASQIDDIGCGRPKSQLSAPVAPGLQQRRRAHHRRRRVS